MLHDLRYAFRSLRTQPGTVAVVLLCLGLGIGANTTIFSFTNAVLFRPLPVHEPGRLVSIHSGWGNKRFRMTSYQEWSAVNARRDAFTGVAGYRRARVSVGRAEETTIEQAGLVTGNFFQVVGLTPAAGRFFSPEEDRVAGEHPIAVLSHAFWTARFGADPSIIDRGVHINGRAYTVIGVGPADFFGLAPDEEVALWVPFMMFGHILGAGPNMLTQNNHSMAMIGRLAPGVRIDQARVAVAGAASDVAARFGAEWKTLQFTVLPGGTLANSEARDVFLILNSVVLLVLLIACANVANIMLARAMSRRRDIAIRLALGSGRWRLIRQLLTESVIMGLLGGVAGITLAYWGADLLILLGVPASIDPAPDVRVLAYAFLISIATGIIFGVLPAFQGTRSNVAEALKQGNRLGLPIHSKLRSTLVVSQVALSVVLLVVASSLLRVLFELRTAKGGYDDQRMIAAEIDLTTLGVDEAQGRLIADQLLERVRALPAVTSAALSTMVPMKGREWGTDARSPESEQFRKEGGRVIINIVSSEYFSTLRIPVVAGRALGGNDRAGQPGVAVVNRTLADRYWPNQNPVGKTLIGIIDDDAAWSVVGVAEDARYENMRDPPSPMMYVSVQQLFVDPTLTLQVRSTADPNKLIAPIRRELQAVRPGLAATFETFEAIRKQSEFQPRMAASLLTIFGALALFLAALGLYGVLAFVVALRTHEIGVRMALGARPSGVLGMVTQQGVRLAAVGVVIGLVLAAGAGKLVSTTLFGVRPIDPLGMIAVSALMFGVAALASIVPARRAARVSPLIALKAE